MFPWRASAAKELNLGLILMDPDRMTDHSIQQNWLANLPAIFDAGPGKFKPAPPRMTTSLPCSTPPAPPPIPRA